MITNNIFVVAGQNGCAKCAILSINEKGIGQHQEDTPYLRASSNLIRMLQSGHHKGSV